MVSGEVPMLRWLWRGMGRSGGTTMSGALGALDEIFNPAAARARELVDEQNERVLPAPSPGDRLLAERRLVIDAAVAQSQDDQAATA
jgi:hypothetical protein